MTIRLVFCASILEADGFLPLNVAKMAAAGRCGRRKRREANESPGLLNIPKSGRISSREEKS